MQTKKRKRSKKKLSKQQLETRRRRMAQKKRRYAEAAWERNGLVRPDEKAPKPGTKAFAKLQREWYAKLHAAESKKPEDKRYVDIEWAGNPDSPHIKQPSSRGRKLSPGKQLYYAMARNFLTHFRFKSMQEKVAWSMHTEGKSYRQILEVMKRDFGVNKSIYWIYHYVRATARKCKKFNSEHAEGLLTGNSDGFADDALIGNFRLEESYSDGEDYGMQLDKGFWESVPKPK